MRNNPYIYILIMFAASYFLRVMPLVLIRREIRNRTIRSFLYYVPYVTLAVMTFPAIMDATDSPFSGLAALIIGICMALLKAGLFPTAMVAVVVVFFCEMVF